MKRRMAAFWLGSLTVLSSRMPLEALPGGDINQHTRTSFAPPATRKRSPVVTTGEFRCLVNTAVGLFGRQNELSKEWVPSNGEVFSTTGF